MPTIEEFKYLLTTPKVAQALGFAITKHGAQKYGDRPYMDHVMAVAEATFMYGQGLVNVVDLVCGALLHDTIEDTGTTKEEISSAFGPDVANIADACTKDEDPNIPKELQPCRRCAFKATVPALRSVPGAKAVKLADRLKNMENSLETRSTHLNMYVREYPEFKSLLWREGEYPELWKRLDEAFEAGTRRKK